MMIIVATKPPANSTVIVRLDRTIQYAAASRLLSGVSGILDPRFRGDDDQRYTDV
jgi:hypothetical protein